MDIKTIVVIGLRLVHIFSGVYWVGAAWMMAFFIEPAMRATGPDGQKFMQKMMEGGRLTLSITVAAILTVLAGGILYWLNWWSVLTTPKGLGFAAGAIIGFIALGVGAGGTGPAAAGLSKLGASIAAGGQPPTPEQMGQIKQFQLRLQQAGRWTSGLTAAALFMMAIARYL
jgi:hypothetical protein